MTRYKFFILGLIYFPLLSFSSFDELGKNKEFLEKDNFQFSGTNLKVVQKRWLERRFLSEVALSFSPAVHGFNYMDSYSADLSYRWFINNYFSFKARYSFYDNPRNQAGDEVIFTKGWIPLELKYPAKQSYLGGIEWYPFYGKAVFYNQLVHFDFYLSALAGQIELLNQEKRAPLYSFSLGVAQWWHKRFNTRIEAQAFYYKYYLLDEKQVQTAHHKYFYKLSFSVGVLF